MDHTAFNLQRTPCLPLLRKRSPDGVAAVPAPSLSAVTGVTVLEYQLYCVFIHAFLAAHNDLKNSITEST